MEKTGNLLVGKVLIDTYLHDNPLLSMQSKILMLNEIIYSKYENEVLGKVVKFPAKERRKLDKKYKTYFGKDDWKGSVYDFYRDFLLSQKEKEYDIDIPKDSFDVYDLAALAYIYKRIKETDPVREASHVVIDEAQDFGMMAYCCLHYCLRNCTYTIMGDTSQNIHFEYGLNDWEDLKKLILTGTYDAFGLLRKSYRNTVEISEFATEILRHGDFAIYPVEPIIRHGNAVRIEEYDNVRTLISASVDTIKGWQSEGYETIAVVCRDEAEALKVSAELKKHIEIADDDIETAQFGAGVMVLPVAYTKGLEFDGRRDMDEREYFGPSRIALKPEQLTNKAENEKLDLSAFVKKDRENQTQCTATDMANKIKIKEVSKAAKKSSLPLNPSPYAYGSIPDNDILHVKGHSKGKFAVKWLKKGKSHVEIATADGTLYVIPITPEIVRVIFVKGIGVKPHRNYWKQKADTAFKWVAKESKSLIEIQTEKLILRIEKKNGALQ